MSRRPVPSARHQPPARLLYDPESVRRDGLAVVFLATPPEVSMELAPDLLGCRRARHRSQRRLPPAHARKLYRLVQRAAHPARELLAEAVYGLPEFCRARIPAARLIANPGCYPTAANLAIRPLIEAGVVDRAAGIVCDAKSGVSGAGRKPSLKTSFCEVTENFSAYSILDHRHVPEVLAGLRPGRGRVQLHRAAPAARPRHSGNHLFPRPRRGQRRGPGGSLPAPLRRRTVRPALQPRPASPTCAASRAPISATSASPSTPARGRAVVVSAIDNLVKGAAGQAIQNMNLLLGYPETEALL